MAKITHGIDPALIDDPIARKFWQIVKNNFREVDHVFGSSVPSGNDPVVGVTDHGALTGLGDDDHLQYLLLAGRSGGQTVQNIASGDVPLLVKGFSGQSVSLQRWLDSSGTLLASVNATGGFFGHQFLTDGSLPVALLGNSGLQAQSSSLTSTLYSDGQLVVSNSFTTSGYTVNAGSVTLGQGGFSALLNTHAITGTTIYGSGSFDNVTLNVRHHTQGTHTADIMRWRNPADTITLAKVDKDGNITAPTITATTGFSGPISLTTLTTRGDLLTRDASSQVRLAVGGAGTFLKSNGTDPSWATPALTDLTGISHLVYDNAATTVSGVLWTFSVNPPNAALVFEGDFSADPALVYFNDTLTGGSMELHLDGNVAIGADPLTFPSVGGVVVTTSATQTLTAKTLSATTALVSSNISSGAYFRDNGNSSKRLRMLLANAAAADHGFVLNNSAQRQYTFRDYNADVVLVGNTNAVAGTLGKSDLTAQTGNIAAVTMLASSANSSGLYRLSFTVRTTTAGSAGSQVKITVASNNGSALTTDVLLTNNVATPAAPGIQHDLTVNNNTSYGEVLVYSAASNAITFTTTGTYNTAPQYTLRARIEALG